LTDFGVTESVVKGLTFNHLTSLAVNFDSIKKIVESKPEERESITVPQFMFIRNKKTWLIKTQVKDKVYRYVYDKRVVNTIDYTTTPYGY
jgi:hypothetical protein